MATHSSILAWRFHEQRSLVGYHPRGHKESDTTELLTLSFSSKSINIITMKRPICILKGKLRIAIFSLSRSLPFFFLDCCLFLCFCEKVMC